MNNPRSALKGGAQGTQALVAKYLSYGDRLKRQPPRNEGSVADFKEFVDFCVKVGKKRRTLADLVEGSLKPVEISAVIKKRFVKRSAK